MTNFYNYETEYWKKGLLIAGADEAGRGPLAGPVVAAAVIIPNGLIIEGINDSKKISEKKRERLFEELISSCNYKVGIIDHTTIDNVNILNAARLAFQEAIEALTPPPAFVYTDYINGLTLSLPHLSLVKGDASVYSIAAASIIAKVTRDRLMREYDKQYPGYGFAAHKGYGTKAHIEAIKELGPCPIHRMSFLKNIL